MNVNGYDVVLWCSYYCGENCAAVQSVQTHRRHQIQVPSSPSTSVADHYQQPSPSKSDVVLLSQCEHSESQTPPAAPSGMTKRFVEDLADDYEERTRTWPRKQSGHRHYQHRVTDDNDPARLAGNQQDLHDNSARLALQHDCKSAETVFTSCLTDDYVPLSPTAAADILGASVAVPSYSQYCINSPPAAVSYAVPLQFNTADSRFHEPPTPTVYSYSTSLSSPYDGLQSGRSPVAGTRETAESDGRHAVDVLFDNLFQSPIQSESDPTSTAAARTFPASPYVPTHIPQRDACYLSSDHYSHAADLTSIHSTPSASDVSCYQR